MDRRTFIKKGGIYGVLGMVAPSLIVSACNNKKERKDKELGSTTSNNEREFSELLKGHRSHWKNMDRYISLVDIVHMADIYSQGLFIDFGTPARFKYTLGQWMSGWGEDRKENGISFTEVVNSPARVFFHMDNPSPLKIKIKLFSKTADKLSLMVNDEFTGSIKLEKNVWKEYEFDVAQQHVKTGENQLKLVTKGEGSPKLLVDYLQIIPSENNPKDSFQPYLDAIKGSIDIAGEKLNILTFYTPISLSYYINLPEDGTLLGFSYGVIKEDESKTTNNKVNIKVIVTDGETNQQEEIYSQTITEQDGWKDSLVSFEKYNNKIIRIALKAESDKEGAKIVLVEPAIYYSKKKVTLPPQKKARNVIIIMIDTLRADHLKLYDDTNVVTPEIVSFANSGVVFERCQAVSNWTKPSCASILTGLYPDTHLARGQDTKVNSDVYLVSELFKNTGEFVTAAFIANGYLAKEFGFNKGWDLYINYIRENKRTEAEYVFKDASNWIEQNKDKRFFVYIHTIDPHVPYDPPQDDLKLYFDEPYSGIIKPRITGQLLEDFKKNKVEFTPTDRRFLHALYKGEITYHDRYFGKFIQKLKELGLLDDTFIVVTSDHGEEFFEHGSVGHGHTLHQELLHVPLIMRMPSLLPQGTRIKEIVSHVDIVPTIIEASGIDLTKTSKDILIEGRSLLNLANNRGSSYWYTGFSSKYSEPDKRNLEWSVRIGDWKLRLQGPPVTYLYNLRTDKNEQEDVDSSYPIIVRTCRILLGQFIGAPDKSKWLTANMIPPIIKREEEKVVIDEEHRAQLRAMGYIH